MPTLFDGCTAMTSLIRHDAALIILGPKERLEECRSQAIAANVPVLLCTGELASKAWPISTMKKDATSYSSRKRDSTRCLYSGMGAPA